MNVCKWPIVLIDKLVLSPPKSTVGAGINSTTMNIDRFTRMNTPNLYATKCRTFSGQMGFYPLEFTHLE
jgi:hypothetical protein